MFKQGNNEDEAVHEEYIQDEIPWLEKLPLPSWSVDWVLIATGILALLSGSRFLVSGAITVAEFLGLSRLIIGLTIIAMGTSLPELATSVMASVRGKRDIAVGNVIGSIFSIF